MGFWDTTSSGGSVTTSPTTGGFWSKIAPRKPDPIENPKIALYNTETAALQEKAKKANSFWGIVKNTVKSIPQGFQKVNQFIGDKVSNVNQSIKEAVQNPSVLGSRLNEIIPTYEENRKLIGQLPSTPEEIEKIKEKSINFVLSFDGGGFGGKAKEALTGKVAEAKAALAQAEKKAAPLAAKAVKLSDEGIPLALSPREKLLMAAENAKAGMRFGPRNPAKVRVPRAEVEARTPEQLSNKKTELEFRRESLSTDPARSLSKFENKRTGELPEVLGGVKSMFGNKGDDIVKSLGFKDSEEARAAWKTYKIKKLLYEDDVKLFRQEQKAFEKTTKDQIAMEKIRDSDSKAGERARQIDELLRDRSNRLAERKAAFEEGVRKAKEEEALLQKKETGIRQAFLDTAEQSQTLFKRLKKSLNPLKYQDPIVGKAYTKWTRGRVLAKEAGNAEFGSIKVPENKGLETIFDFQAGKATPYSKEIKDTFDRLFKEATDAGLDIEYRPNYLPQVYKESPVEIRQHILNYLLDNGFTFDDAILYMEGKPVSTEITKRLGLKPFFSKERVFPDYKTAMEYGLTPKFVHPDQLAAYYKNNLEKTIADKKFIDTMIEESKVLPVEVAPASWAPVNLPFSPKGYYAKPDTARFLNGVFKGIEDRGFMDTIISGMAKVSAKAQEIALSAGLPGTSVNFFSIGQLIKQLTAGDLKAASAFIRANSDARSIKYFQKNSEFIQKMAQEGLDLGGRIGTYDTVYDSLAKEWRAAPKNVAKKETWQAFGQLAGNAFDKAFNKKTFANFIPQLHIETFKRTFKNGIKKGMPEDEARQLAGTVTKKMFGLMDDVGRSQATKDKLSAAFFAPKFRESIINTLFNTGSAGADFVKQIGGLRGKLNPAFKENRKLLAGMILTYGLYNVVNKELNGNYMWDNPEHRKFALQIPRKDGELVYVEFMPSFLAFARNMISGTISLGKGDLKAAGQQLGSVFSMPIKTTTEILGNRDYFGNEIYKDTDTGAQKALKIAKYVGLAVNHPYIKETLNQIEEKKPLHQSIVAALELPLKFSSKDKVASAEFYDAIDKKAKANAQEVKRMQPIYDHVQELVAAGNKTEAQKIVDKLSKEDYAIYSKIRASDRRRQTVRSEALMFDVVKQVEALKAGGNLAEAQAIVNGLTDEEYRIYQLAKNKL